MKRKMMIHVALFLVLGVSLFAAGGSQSAAESTTAPRIKGTLPIGDGKTGFTVFIGGLDKYVTSYDYKDNLFTKRIVDETGIPLTFIATTAADRTAKLNVLLNSGDYPDLIMGANSGSFSLADMSFYASQGIIIPLDQYDPYSYKNIGQALKDNPEIEKVLRGNNGKMYGLPHMNDYPHGHYNSNPRSIYYMRFLRDNNRKLPETLDEFRDYLRWVRDNDVNKNGNKNDEVPMVIRSGMVRPNVAWFAKSYMPFVQSTSYFGLALENQKVVEQYKDNRFREALKFMAGLYAEGLIAKDSFTMTADQLLSLGESKDPVLAVFIGGAANNVATFFSTRWLGWVTFAHVMKGPDGKFWGTNNDPWAFYAVGMYITDKCKKPEMAIELYDYLLNFDVQMDGYIGPRGKAWDYPDIGGKGRDGEPAQYKLLINYNSQIPNTSWYERNPRIKNEKWFLSEQVPDEDLELARKWFATGDESLGEQAVKRPTYNEIYNSMVTAIPAIPYAMPTEYFIPPIALGDTDSARLADINATLDTYLDQAMTEFITGRRNINDNNAWNAYLAELDRLGSKEKAAILQKYIK
jgi:putative aldouronate transport system substrate-binding protein